MIYAKGFIESHPLRLNDLKQHLHKKEKLQKLISLCIPQHWIHMQASISYQKLKEKYGSLKHKRLSSYGEEEWVFRGQRHAYNGEEKQKHPKVLKVEAQQQIKFSKVGLKEADQGRGLGRMKTEKLKNGKKKMNKSIWRCWNGGTNQPTLEIDTAEADREGKGNTKEQTNPKWQRTTYNGVAL